ncbi:TauD/TfdA family dioxygenase [Noviherbaspirillum pedocola]|uniref:TauD/TfdA family dioxygenase n=1 Tax=Noviherbaspirillum pedocola TaxID=2801341 RepID=A0A934WAL5_9BURK|nr:TauD/TfdA family dioxygenase [Noviherbaspirillum pedocola]MBK4739314.1 TauD/TfdA family dioxygenase [Noviherbaspirillum pedocola]
MEAVETSQKAHEDNQKIVPRLAPAAWSAATLKKDQRWIFKLSQQDITELEAALAYTKMQNRAVPGITKEDFPLPQLARKLEDIRAELETGFGVALVQGLPVEKYTKADAGVIYWGIGTHLGRFAPQNAFGDVLGHVYDLGKNPRVDMNARGYQSNRMLPFHTDAADVVGLLCLRPAKAGGLSSIASSVTIHNEIAARRPDLLALLYGTYAYDRRGEEGPGEKPYTMAPIYTIHKGKLYNRFIRNYIESAQRFPEVPRLTAPQIEALDLFDELTRDPRFRFDMDFAPGDMQFLNNYVVLHSRTEYEDYPETDRKRHLLRLWLFTPGMSDIPPIYKERHQILKTWETNPRPPIYDVNEIMGVTNH